MVINAVCRVQPTKQIGCLLACLMSVVALTASDQAQVLDRVVRVVNDDIVTSAELQMRVQETMIIARRSGADMPRNREELLALRDSILEELTDELLLNQEVKRLGLAIDERPIQRQVSVEVKRLGRNTTLAEQAEEVERRVEEQERRALIQFFDQHTADISPTQLQQAYAERAAEFMRPAQREWIRVSRRSATDSDQRRLVEASADIFRRASVAKDPAIAALITDEVRLSLVQAKDDRMPVLLPIVEQVGAIVTEQKADAQLIADAKKC